MFILRIIDEKTLLWINNRVLRHSSTDLSEANLHILFTAQYKKVELFLLLGNGCVNNSVFLDILKYFNFLLGAESSKNLHPFGRNVLIIPFLHSFNGILFYFNHTEKLDRCCFRKALDPRHMFVQLTN